MKQNPGPRLESEIKDLELIQFRKKSYVKGRHVKIQILVRVEKEIEKFVAEQNIVMSDKRNGEFLIARTLFTAKKDESFKLALKAERVNSQIGYKNPMDLK